MTLRTSNQLFDAYFSAESMAEVFCDQGRPATGRFNKAS